MAGIKVSIDTSRFDRAMTRAAVGFADFSIPIRAGADAYRLEHGKAWDAVKYATGGVNFRGTASWPAAKDQYQRKDGTAVPAWGNVQKARGRGKVKARTRPSGQPVKPGDVMMVDTANMRNDYLANPSYLRGGNRVEFTARKEYSGAQNARRPFVFFAKVDIDRFTSECSKYARAVLRVASARRG